MLFEYCCYNFVSKFVKFSKTVVFTFPLASFLLVLCVTSNAVAIPKNSSFVIMDYNSGTVLDSSNKDVEMQPASLTKLMTLSIVFDMLSKNKIKLTDKLTVSKTASDMPASKLWLAPGSQISVQDAINAMIVKSANDVAYVVAENLADNGKVDSFIAVMNAKASALGMKHTHFTNPNGLSNSKQYSSAYDLALLARNIMIHHSNFYHLFSQKTFKWKKYYYHSTNHLLDYGNIDGLKTGYTFAAGFNMVVSTEINGVRVIVSTLGNPSSEKRDNIVKQLVNSGVVIANNFYLDNIKYKSPPKEVLLASNKSNRSVIAKGLSVDNYSDINFDSDGVTDTIIDATNPPKDQGNGHTSMLASSNKTEDADGDDVSTKSTVSKVSFSTNTSSNTVNNTHKKVLPKISSTQKYYLQVGIFNTAATAKNVANQYKKIIPNSVAATTKVSIDTVKLKKKNTTLYRVRFTGLTHNQATQASSSLKRKKVSSLIGRM